MTLMRWRAATSMTNDVIARFWAGKATQEEVDRAWEYERKVLAEWGGPEDDPEAG